jgi:phage/plasmid primase-like uncharacterized protein
VNIDYRDIERQVISFMESSGITPPRELVLDGKTHRYPVEADRHGSKSGAYCIHTDGWPAGWVQDFHLGDAVYWKFDLDQNARAEWKRQSETPQAIAAREVKKADAERQRQEENASKIKTALATYKAAHEIEEAPDHAYLLAKHVTPRGGFPFGGQWCDLRVGDMTSQSGKLMGGLLLIPMMDLQTGRLCALHRVFGRPGADGKFSKGWCTPAGGVFPVGFDALGGPVVAAEGIATALALYDYLTDELNEPATTVIATMDAGNFVRQASAIRTRYAN